MAKPNFTFHRKKKEIGQVKAEKDSTYYGDVMRGKHYKMFEYIGQNSNALRDKIRK